MEPTEPIHGGHQNAPSVGWRLVGWCRRFVLWYFDFVVCSFALFGLAIIAGIFASYRSVSSGRSVLMPVHIREEGDAAFAVFLAIGCLASSVAGFTYMLLRYNGRYRLSTLFKIGLFWVGTLAAVKTDPQLATAAGAPLILVYALIWSCRRKGLPE
jgi:hypothetical protein